MTCLHPAFYKVDSVEKRKLEGKKIWTSCLPVLRLVPPEKTVPLVLSTQYLARNFFFFKFFLIFTHGLLTWCISYVFFLNHHSPHQLGAELKARAISHLEEVSDEGIQAMSAESVIAVLLPTTAYILRLKCPPARKMIESGTYTKYEWLSYFPRRYDHDDMIDDPKSNSSSDHVLWSL